MNKKKLTKKLTILSTTNDWKVLTITGIALLASSVYLGNAQAQSFTNSGSLSPKAEALGQEAGGKRIVEISARPLERRSSNHDWGLA
jgi:hypothetical protein